MFWTEEKIDARIKELDGFQYRDRIKIPEFSLKVDPEGTPGTRPSGDGEWEIVTIPHRWSGRDLYVWLRAFVTVPAAWREKQAVGLFDFGRTGGGNNSGFESLLYINESPYQGVDSNHTEVFLSTAWTGADIQLDFRLWSGLEGGGKPTVQEHVLKQAEIAWLDESVDDLYFTSKAALETVKILPMESPERVSLLVALDRAFQEVDWAEPGSFRFYESIQAAREVLHFELGEITSSHPVTVNCIGHTHIDVAWLWRLKHTREKAARSFSTVLRLMEKFPEYVFLQTQPQLYDYIKTDYPEIFANIKARVKERRWEAGGAMWLESDCNLTSGESLVRQILFGTRFLRDEFGVECNYLWLPDVFGYSWALPQILKKSGIHTFMTTKISWNQYNRMPHDTFRWRGMDGTEILAHFITTPEVTSPENNWFYTYNGIVTPKSVQGLWNAYRDKSVNRELLLSYGYGDGGGGVNREMLEMRRRLEDMPGLPKVVTGRADDFFAKLNDQFNRTDQYVHTWDGELYLEYHRGTYTSQGLNKRRNRKLELLYRETEWMNVLSSVFDGSFRSYQVEAVHEGWKIILRNQFHDIIPGSSIHEVYEDSQKEYDEAEKLASAAWEVASQLIVSKQLKNQFTIFNSSPWVRSDIVRIELESGRNGSTSVNRDAQAAGEVPQGKSWVDANHTPLLAEMGHDGAWYVYVSSIPPLGFMTIQLIEKEESVSETGFRIMDRGIKTPYYEIEWNSNGQLTRIYDQELNREILPEGKCGNVIQIFEDKPMSYDAWDIDIFYQQKMREVTNLVSVKPKEIGPVRAVISFEWEHGKSHISQDLVLYSHSRRIDFRTVVDWRERQRLMKAAFPTSIRATEATYDIQFGNVKRPTHWNTSWDYARFESVAHQWVDLSERNFGVSLLNDCKYGHDVKDGVLRISLLKSANYPDVEADLGKHVFTYSLLPHSGDWFEGRTVEEAWQLNNPLTYASGQPHSPEFSMFRISSQNVMVDAVKKAEDEDKVVLRLHEFAGSRSQVEITSDLQIASWQECNLLEQTGQSEQGMDSLIKFEIKPYEIKTFLIEFTR